MLGPRPLPARQPSVRGHNLALVLAHVADAGPASRARIAASTGLTKATVSSLVETLTAGGLLVELGADRAPTPLPGPAQVGRPGSVLAMSPRGPVGVGLEINVDYLATTTVDLAGQVRRSEVLVEDLRGLPVPAVLDRAAGAVRRALDAARALALPVAGLAVAVPGLVESGRPVLRVAPNLGWRDVAVLAEISARAALAEGDVAGVPLPEALRLDNEANFAALAELWCGQHRGPDGRPLDTFVHVSGEIGVGAGLVVGGALLRGRHGFAGELGHVAVGPLGADGPACRCGATGCLELVAGQDAILRRAGLGDLPPSRTGRSPVDVLVARAEQGEPQVLEALRTAGTALGIGIATAVNLVDVDAVVLGGTYARLAPWLVGPVESELARRVLAAAWHPVSLVVSTLGDEAAVRGAATSVVRQVIADPAAHLAAG